jgi:hypothetical protein
MDDAMIGGIGLLAIMTILALTVGGIVLAIHNTSLRVKRGWQVVKAETKTAFQLERELHQGARLCFAQLLTRYRTGELAADDAWTIFRLLYPGLAQQMFEQWREQTRA